MKFDQEGNVTSFGKCLKRIHLWLTFPTPFVLRKCWREHLFWGPIPSAPLTGVNNCPHREEEDRALPGAEPSGPRPSLSAQYQPHHEKQLHYHTDGGMCSSLISRLYCLLRHSLTWWISKHFVGQRAWCYMMNSVKYAPTNHHLVLNTERILFIVFSQVKPIKASKNVKTNKQNMRAKICACSALESLVILKWRTNLQTRA